MFLKEKTEKKKYKLLVLYLWNTKITQETAVWRKTHTLYTLYNAAREEYLVITNAKLYCLSLHSFVLKLLNLKGLNLKCSLLWTPTGNTSLQHFAATVKFWDVISDTWAIKCWDSFILSICFKRKEIVSFCFLCTVVSFHLNIYRNCDVRRCTCLSLRWKFFTCFALFCFVCVKRSFHPNYKIKQM